MQYYQVIVISLALKAPPKYTDGFQATSISCESSIIICLMLAKT